METSLSVWKSNGDQALQNTAIWIVYSDFAKVVIEKYILCVCIYIYIYIYIYKQWNLVLRAVVGSEMHYLPASVHLNLSSYFQMFFFFFLCMCDEFISPKLSFPSVLQDAACGNNGNRQEIKLRHLTASDLWGVSLLCAHHIWPTVDPFINAQHLWRSSLVDTPHQPGRGGSSSKTK